MVSFSAQYLHKIENLLKEAGINLRYEKGNFKSGYCLLSERRLVIINKFSDTEAKVNAILTLLPELQIDEANLTPGARKILAEVLQTRMQQFL